MDSVRDFLFMKALPIIGIYKITSPKGKIYIGQSRNIKKRFQSYKGLSKKNKGQPKLYNSLLKHGASAHYFEVIEECEFLKLNIRERHWQDHFCVIGENGLNCTLTETDLLPKVVSDETKLIMSNNAFRRMERLVKDHEYMAKMKANGRNRRGVSLPKKSAEQKELSRQICIKNKSFKGKNNPWFNKPRFGSENPNFGVVPSEETREKIRIKAIGRNHSDKSKELMSKKRRMEQNVNAKLVLNLETGIYYECGKEAWLSINHYAWTTLRCKMNGNAKNTTSFVYV